MAQLVYANTGELLNDVDKQATANEIAEYLGYGKPAHLLALLTSASHTSKSASLPHMAEVFEATSISKTDWQKRAQKEIADGYARNKWEAVLDRRLRALLPEQVRELELLGNYEAYLQVKVARAIKYYNLLIKEGQDKHIAQEMVLDELLMEDQGTG